MGSTSWPRPNADPNLDRLVDDIKYEQLFSIYGQDGLVGSPTDPDPVYANGSGRTVLFRPYQKGMVRGYGWRTDASGVTLPVNANTGSANRIDLAVLRLDRSTWTITEAVRAGVAGGPAPSPVQDLDGTFAGSGVWETPLAQIKVVPGATTITATDVTWVGPYLAPQPIVTDSDGLPANPRVGQIAAVTDKQRVYASVTAGKWHLIGEDGPSTRIAPTGTIWRDDALVGQRRNGWTFFQGLIYRKSTGSAIPAGTDVTVAVIPAPYRPGQSMYLEGTHNGAKARFYINAANGALLFLGSALPLDVNQYLTIHPVTFPSNDL